MLPELECSKTIFSLTIIKSYISTTYLQFPENWNIQICSWRHDKEVGDPDEPIYKTKLIDFRRRSEECNGWHKAEKWVWEANLLLFLINVIKVENRKVCDWSLLHLTKVCDWSLLHLSKMYKTKNYFIYLGSTLKSLQMCHSCVKKVISRKIQIFTLWSPYTLKSVL